MHYGLGAHSKVETADSHAAECERIRKMAEDAELKRARILNGKHPDYKNGCACKRRKPCDPTQSQAGADAAPGVGETPS